MQPQVIGSVAMELASDEPDVPESWEPPDSWAP
jgi:hypothetical protein